MSKIRVGVLRGGPSNEYHRSLKAGADVLKHFRELQEKYIVHDVFIAKDGTWHFQGVPVTPLQLGSHVDVFFTVLLGAFGEDGQVQKILDFHGFPYVGSEAMPSAVSLNKSLAKKVCASHGIKVPYSIEVQDEGNIPEQALRIFKTFSMPAIVKPVCSGGSLGVSFAKDIFSLEVGMKEAFKYSPKILIEEYIKGREAVCGVIEGFRGQDLYVTFPAEIIKPEGLAFYDSHTKTSGSARKICPGKFTEEEKKEIERISKLAHSVLGLRHYSRVDLIVHPRRGVFLLEVNRVGSFDESSLLSVGLSAVGATIPEFLAHVIERARAKK